MAQQKSASQSCSSLVLLHVFRPTPRVVNASPACLKLETFLRMAKIPYETDTSRKTSSKGKMPWIEFNGRPMADSNFCIRFLNKELGVDVDSHLSETERSIAHTILTMLEENTYWWVLILLCRFGARPRKKVRQRKLRHFFRGNVYILHWEKQNKTNKQTKRPSVKFCSDFLIVAWNLNLKHECEVKGGRQHFRFHKWLVKSATS